MTTLTFGGGAKWFKYWQPEDGQIIVDIGAAVGQVSGEIMERWNKDVKIIAIDPHPRAWPLFEERLKGHEKNYVLVKKGVSDRKETKMLISPKIQLDKVPGLNTQYYTAGWSEIGPQWNKMSVEQRERHYLTWKVELDTLDNILLECEVTKVDYIKVDTRGMEEKVLRGFTKYKKGTKFHIEWAYNLDKILYELMVKKISVTEINFDADKNGILGAIFAEE